GLDGDRLVAPTGQHDHREGWLVHMFGELREETHPVDVGQVIVEQEAVDFRGPTEGQAFVPGGRLDESVFSLAIFLEITADDLSILGAVVDDQDQALPPRHSASILRISGRGSWTDNRWKARIGPIHTRWP